MHTYTIVDRTAFRRPTLRISSVSIPYTLRTLTLYSGNSPSMATLQHYPFSKRPERRCSFVAASAPRLCLPSPHHILVTDPDAFFHGMKTNEGTATYTLSIIIIIKLLKPNAHRIDIVRLDIKFCTFEIRF